MTSLDEILERSKKPGRFVERKHFTLSRGRAIEKLREFSLRDPRQYILELVQGAVFSGATYLAIDVDRSHVLVAWVGAPPLQGHQLENLFDYLFVDRGAAETRHLAQLAVGLNALLQRKPKVLRIESGDGSAAGTLRLDLDRHGKGSLGRPTDALRGTYVMAEFASSWFARFQGRSFTHEERLVEENCRHTPVPILLNGRAPFGYKAATTFSVHGTHKSRTFNKGNRRGVLYVPQGGRSRAEVQIVIGGVRVTNMMLPQLGTLGAPTTDINGTAARTLSGVIADDQLRKTADQSDIVQDHRFIDMLHAVQPEATALLRELRGKAYRAPALPRRLKQEVEPSTVGPIAEPLPEELPQLGRRPAIEIDALEALPPETPVFRVRPEDADGLLRAAAPDRFSHLVFVLTDGQTLSLDAELPGLAVHRLSAGADVEFVRRMVDRRQEVRRSVQPWRSPDGAVHGSLELQLTLSGACPRWGVHESGDVPVVVSDADQVHWLGTLSLGLPGMSVQLRLELPRAYRWLPDTAAQESIRTQVLRQTWSLLPPAGEAAGPADAAALCGLMAAHAWPHFVRADADGRVGLDAHLGAAPSREAAHLARSLPLASDCSPPLSLARFLSIQGSSEVISLGSRAALDHLGPLEERFGYGHLHHASLDQPVLLVGRMASGWRSWVGLRTSSDAVQQAVWVSPSLAPLDPGPGWTTVDLGLPGIGAAVRTGEPAEDWTAGLVMLRHQLSQRVRSDGWSELVGPHADLARVRALGREALTRLVCQLDGLGTDLVFQTSAGSDWQSFQHWLAQPGFSVSPRFGPAVTEHSTLLLSLTELQLLEAALGQALPLRFDDAPEVWATLVRPSDEGWLLRQQVAVPGLGGWLGLRTPFDPTTGVFVRSAGTLVALPVVDAAVPCHGMLDLSGGGAAPSKAQLDLLLLARQQLYQRLAQQLATWTGAEASAGRRYAMVFVRAEWQRRAGRLGGTAEDLAQRVRVSAEDGTHWGTLKEWLEAPEHRRPKLPIPDPGSLAPAPAKGPRSPQSPEHLRQLARRLRQALEGAGCPMRVQIEEGAPVMARWAPPESGRRVRLQIQAGHPVVQRSARGDRVSRELLVLELARQAGLWARSHDLPFDLPAVQTVLVAQRLG